MKVLLLIPTLDQSGAEKQLTLLACRLPRDEFNVQVVALTRGGPYAATLKQAGIPLTVIGKRWKFDPLAWWRLRRIVRERQPDILHTWLFAANAYGRLVVNHNRRPKVIASERCVDTWKSGWQQWLDRRLISRTDRLVGNSDSVAEYYRQLGYPAERVVAIPNGIEVGTPAVASAPTGPAGLPVHRGIDRMNAVTTNGGGRQALLAQFDIPGDAKIVGYVGRLARQKRLKDLLWAMEMLRHLEERAYFLVIGDGPERDRLVRFARDIECESRIRFLGHRDDVSQLLQVFDVFWLASDFEGQSNSIMEAMAAGIPVVASDIPPNRELVVDGETGYLVTVGNCAAFSQFAAKLFKDDDLASRMGAAGLTRMQNSFNIEKMVDSYAALYRAVCTGERGAP